MNILTQLKRYMVLLVAGLACATAAEAAHVGPTDNITKVANAIQVRSMSLATLVAVPAGLALTQPVEISVGYYSPMGGQRLIYTYSAATGTRFLHSDREGDGSARTMNVDITLSEKKPGGGVHAYAMSKKVALEPLYRVSIGPLFFRLNSSCEASGDNEIKLTWLTADRKKEKTYNFSTPVARTNTISDFSWSAAAVAPSYKFILPDLMFQEIDGYFVRFARGVKDCVTFESCGGFASPLGTNGQGPLVPGQSRIVRGSIKEKNGGCHGTYEFQVESTLVFYPYF